jgi:hypothetical protein
MWLGTAVFVTQSAGMVSKRDSPGHRPCHVRSTYMNHQTPHPPPPQTFSLSTQHCHQHKTNTDRKTFILQASIIFSNSDHCHSLIKTESFFERYRFPYLHWHKTLFGPSKTSTSTVSTFEINTKTIKMVSSTQSSRSASPELALTMQIFVKDLSGDSKPSTSLLSNSHSPDHSLTFSPPAVAMTVPSDLTIQNLTTLLSIRTSLPESSLRLVHAGKHLSSSPSSTLADNHIQREATIHLAAPLRGGMPPKKIRCTHKDCKEAAQRIIGDCGFCNGSFCGKHRLLEDHKCTGLEDVSLSSSSSSCCTELEDSPRWWLVGLDKELLADMMM